MPVHSKPFAGRAKNAPPLVGPKPYQKPSQNGPQQAWVTPDSPVLRNFSNGPTNNDDSQNIANVQFSVIRRPAEKKPDKVPKSPQVVRFGAAEIFGGEKYEDVAYRRQVNQPDIVGECLSSAINQTTKSRGSSSSLSGAQALKECEEHTDWANEVLTRHNLPLISDLRKSIGDGFTLPTILEIIAGVSLSCVKTSPTTKEERVCNILHCLKFLCRRGVSVSGIEPSEIEDGHLKSVLLLVGNIRQHFKNTYRPEQNGFAHHVPDLPEITNKSPVEANMPGTMKLPGAVPTPFVPHGSRNNVPEAASRKSGHHEEEMLPGVLGRDVNSNDTHKPHYNIISTTEIGTNGVAQHGVDERKHHFANNNNNNTSNRGMVIRHPNARTSAQNMHEQSVVPPSVTQRAWTGSPRLQHNNMNGSSMSPSVEDRLKNLLGSSSSRSSSRDNLGYFGGGFHGGSSEILDDDDGEILIVPQPMSRNSADFEAAMSGDHGYGPGYRPPASQHTRQRSQQGYVPSKPSERVQGSRAEVIISRPPSAIAFRKTAPSRAAPQSVPGSAPGNSHDSSPFNHGSPSPNNYGNRGGNQQVGENVNKPPSQLKAGSNDLRNAWNKLYGPQTPYGGSSMKRGDQLRSSYGHQSPQRQANHVQQHSVTFAPPQSQMANRPVSAPAPAHMQAYFHAQEQHLQGQGQSQSQENLDNQGQSHAYTSHQRESPMGQSSSTQGHLDESSSSQQSRLSQEQLPKHLQVQTSTDNNYGKLSQSSHSSLSQPSPNSPGSPNYAIGPASKYPDNPGSRPSSARKPSVPPLPASPSHRQNRPRLPLPHQSHDNMNRNDLRHSNQLHNKFSEDLTSALQAASKDHKNSDGYSFDDFHDRSHDQSHDMSLDFQNRSIFDYNPPSRSESTGSVTPPLPPLSPTNTPPDSPQMELNSHLPRSLSATNVSSATGRIDEADGIVQPKRKPRRTSEINFKMERERQPRGKKMKNRGFRPRGASLNDVKESGTDTESNLSFDIDDTILTVESHDTEQPHPAGDILSSQEVTTLRDQLHNLEFKYHDLQNKVVHDRPVGHRLHQHMGPGKGQGFGPPPIGRQRRWSIGSSDTSSFRREAKYKPGKQIHHKYHSKEFKNINKRFQRLESHVVTLARSVAHLSSELRTHNTMVNDLEAVKRELRELRDNPSRPFPNMIDRTMAEQERFRDWVPSLTNPKRVNKLTKFFGSEPPLLELFLEKLGYKKYITNFQSEHIGMIELPYMTEDRLEKIGVPMGPRIRILQEAQSCFRHENMNIYLV